jgi:hypothetical protein
MSKKYRPYLSLEMMNRIIYHCENSIPREAIDSEILYSLRTMCLKAKYAITQPSFTPLVDKLGIPESESEPIDPDEIRFTSGQMSPEEASAYQAKLMERF